KFNASGAIQWASYFGGSGMEDIRGLDIDFNSNIFLIGYTTSTSGIATSGAYQTTNGGSSDMIIAKFNSSGNRIWATYYGGTGIDQGNGLSVDNNSNLFISGRTQSTTSIASSGACQTTYGGTDDAFVVKFH